tara:strand:+ start:1033 stop:1368 length:336 start_codon:yes stop_codon:yes gene_type:complete
MAKQDAIMNNTFDTSDSTYEFDSVDGVTYNQDEECLPKEDVVDLDIPDYYIGSKYKYEARKVVEDFELSYNIGTAVTYLLRAFKKHPTPNDCIVKAMAHLKFELDRLKNND